MILEKSGRGINAAPAKLRRLIGGQADRLLLEQHYRVADGPLAGGVGRLVDQLIADGHGGGAAAVEVDGFLGPEGVHDVRALPEARPHAVAGSPSVDCDEEQITAGRYARERARVAPDTEAVVELRVLRPVEALGVGVDVGGAAREEARAAVDHAGPRSQGCTTGGDTRRDADLGAGPRVGAQPVSTLSGSGEDGAVGRYGAATTIAQGGYPARGVEDGLGAGAGLGRCAEDGGELDHLAPVRAGEVVLGPLGRLVAALAAAAPDEARFTVAAVHLAGRAVGGPGGQMVREGGNVCAFAGALGQYQVRPAVHRLANEVAVQNRDAGQITRRAVVLPDNEVT